MCRSLFSLDARGVAGARREASQWLPTPAREGRRQVPLLRGAGRGGGRSAAPARPHKGSREELVLYFKHGKTLTSEFIRSAKDWV